MEISFSHRLNPSLSDHGFNLSTCSTRKRLCVFWIFSHPGHGKQRSPTDLRFHSIIYCVCQRLGRERVTESAFKYDGRSVDLHISICFISSHLHYTTQLEPLVFKFSLNIRMIIVGVLQGQGCLIVSNFSPFSLFFSTLYFFLLLIFLFSGSRFLRCRTLTWRSAAQ